jgi:two-component system nitrogen regulation sensor histidine kinase NtrY
LRTLKPGEKTNLRALIHDESMQLSLHATEFGLGSRIITLVSIQNIQSELEEQEMKAWQNLIRVMTHEIMNSITPIASLAATANSRLNDDSKTANDNGPDGFDPGTIQDVRQAVDAIHRRSTGLIRFVESYRNLTQIPKPDFKILPVRDLLENAKLLLDKEIVENDIRFSISINPESLTVMADEELITQVLINLIRNALQSTKGREGARIALSARTGNFGRTVIQIEDNGIGINEDTLDKIFIPFFTTHPDGSGIGLSLSRQIMRMHGAAITAQSIPNQETTFTLRF